MKVVITGGTGTLGKETIRRLHQEPYMEIVNLSRNEFNQFTLKKEFPRVTNFIGDVTILEDVRRACKGAHYIVHCAALKHVSFCENNITKAVEINFKGSENVCKVAEEIGCDALLISTDKAVNPLNVYGKTKALAEDIFKAYNQSIIRFGNFIGSRGSVIEYFYNLKNKKNQAVPITDLEMERYWISVEEGVEHIYAIIKESIDVNPLGFPSRSPTSLILPKMGVLKMGEILEICKISNYKIIGAREGEKLDEDILNSNESIQDINIDKKVPAYQVVGYGNREPFDEDIFSEYTPASSENAKSRIRRIFSSGEFY